MVPVVAVVVVLRWCLSVAGSQENVVEILLMLRQVCSEKMSHACLAILFLLSECQIDDRTTRVLVVMLSCRKDREAVALMGSWRPAWVADAVAR